MPQRCATPWRRASPCKAACRVSGSAGGQPRRVGGAASSRQRCWCSSRFLLQGVDGDATGGAWRAPPCRRLCSLPPVQRSCHPAPCASLPPSLAPSPSSRAIKAHLPPSALCLPGVDAGHLENTFVPTLKNPNYTSVTLTTPNELLTGRMENVFVGMHSMAAFFYTGSPMKHCAGSVMLASVIHWRRGGGGRGAWKERGGHCSMMRPQLPRRAASLDLQAWPCRTTRRLLQLLLPLLRPAAAPQAPCSALSALLLSPLRDWLPHACR